MCEPSLPSLSQNLCDRLDATTTLPCIKKHGPRSSPTGCWESRSRDWRQPLSGRDQVGESGIAVLACVVTGQRVLATGWFAQQSKSQGRGYTALDATPRRVADCDYPRLSTRD